MTATAQKIDAAGATAGIGAGAMIKDAIAAAVLTFLLCFPIIMLHAESDNDGNLFPDLAALGRRHPLRARVRRALRVVVLSGAAGRRTARSRRPPRLRRARRSSARYIGVFGLVVLFVFPLAVWRFARTHPAR